MYTNFKIKYKVLLLMLLVVIVGVAYYINKDTLRDNSIDVSSIKKIESINDIENKEIYKEFNSLINNNKTDTLRDDTYGYIVICVGNTDKDIEIKDCRYNSNTGNIEILWRLSNSQNTGEYSKKVGVYKIEHYGHNIKLIKDTTNTDLRNVIIYKSGDKNVIYDIDGLRVADEINIGSWYGDGLYSITLDNNNIDKYKKLKSVELECTVLECNNSSVRLQLYNGYIIDAVNKGKLVQTGLDYNVTLYNGTTSLEAIVGDTTISPV